MDLTPLIEELKKSEYEGKSDEECVTLVNAKTVVVRKPVPVQQLKLGMIEAGVFAELQLAVNDDLATPAVKRAAINALGLIENQKAVDLDSPLAQSILSALVATDFCTQVEVDALLAKVNQTVSWTKANGFDVVGLGYVTLARKG